MVRILRCDSAGDHSLLVHCVKARLQDLRTKSCLVNFSLDDAACGNRRIDTLSGEDVLATIWFRFEGYTTIDIAGMFTQPELRRTGYASALFRKLLQEHPHVTRVVTASGTRYARPWLLKHGFQWVEPKGWVLAQADVDRLRNSQYNEAVVNINERR